MKYGLRVGAFTAAAFVGAAITMFLRSTPKERPLTHDLIGHIFTGLGVRVERVIVNDLKNSTYFARLILHAENELGKKILEIDARPSAVLLGPDGLRHDAEQFSPECL